MVRKPRNPGSDKAPVIPPASGIRAKRVGQAGPAKGASQWGDGWGGPPRGAGKGPAFSTLKDPGTLTGKALNERQAAAKADPEKRARRKKAKADKAERVEQFNNHLADLALNATREETQVSATIALLNRLEGLPVATNKNFNAETSFDLLVKASLKPKTEGNGGPASD